MVEKVNWLRGDMKALMCEIVIVICEDGGGDKVLLSIGEMWF